jgi:hypothetical protein
VLARRPDRRTTGPPPTVVTGTRGDATGPGAPSDGEEDAMIGAYPSEVVRVVCALLSPFIAMFGLYIIAHGHYGPGGGFAGGVFLAVGAILPRLTLPEDSPTGSSRRARPARRRPRDAAVPARRRACRCWSAARSSTTARSRSPGSGGPRPLPRHPGRRGAVGLAVFGAMLLIFDVLTGGRAMIELFLDRYVYLLVSCLLAIGLYGMLAKGRPGQEGHRLTIFSTAIYLFFIQGSLQEGGTAPIIDGAGPTRPCTSTRSPTC